ncbi:MAG: SDR family NAD(P)-dependent oxidoreductase [Ignavibacteriales bacterium]|nr:SDR family NAD(P)-dependent oxidoreductase [Ignavibacteriales bacterium]
MSKIVITGGAGFIGSHIAEQWLELGQEVVAVDNLRTGKRENLAHIPGVQFIEASVTDKKTLEQLLTNTGAVYHFASMVSVPESFEDPRECFEINTFGLLNIIAACLPQKDAKIMYSSSAAVYGDNPNLPLKTTAAANPLSPYGTAKLTGEQLLQQYHVENKLQYVAFRHFNVYGPRQDPKGAYASVIPLFITKALRNEDITIYGDGLQVRDFIYVKDVARANVLAYKQTNVNGLFNVASGSEISINTLAELVIRLTKSTSKIIHTGKRKGDILLSTADVAATKDILGFSPVYTIEEGLLETIEYYKKTIF